MEREGRLTDYTSWGPTGIERQMSNLSGFFLSRLQMEWYHNLHILQDLVSVTITEIKMWIFTFSMCFWKNMDLWLMGKDLESLCSWLQGYCQIQGRKGWRWIHCQMCVYLLIHQIDGRNCIPSCWSWVAEVVQAACHWRVFNEAGSAIIWNPEEEKSMKKSCCILKKLFIII